MPSIIDEEFLEAGSANNWILPAITMHIYGYRADSKTTENTVALWSAAAQVKAMGNQYKVLRG